MWFTNSKKKNYKYLVVNGCSQTLGQNCVIEETWPVKLANKLGLKVINLACAGTGWYHVQNSTMSFIQNNKKILNDCFFIFQTSMLERRLNYDEIPIVRTDVWEKFNIKFISKSANTTLGFNDWQKYSEPCLKPKVWENFNLQFSPPYTETHLVDCNLNFFPEHRHYSNKTNHWKLGKRFDIIPKYIDEQFEELMIYWGREISSFHFLIKNLNINHIIVDGYSPFVSHNLQFKNYYENNQEYDFITKFWGNTSLEGDLSEIKLYNFKNIKSKWLYDLIDSKYKITNTILWNAYLNQNGDEWSPDGGHAGPKGMDRIVIMIYDNLISKGWFDEVHN